ncbi:ABC transporter permease subunit [Actinoallomurus bryophytorum]|uniref:Putative spermidine/putrescine transport system permease protein n=1 Tax=Actinoallomurus bryophytorum TaxID=1490222 RepID=A0A543CES2_9ACTN|nr:ABC transporter permease subunit [Actinoallomurus bryophytorum]TQL95579.1 putative spermidine/putrescine transport system permease protein [Actinoallomurus bryophytorum]
MAAVSGGRRVTLRPGAWLVWGAVVFFMLILAGVVGAVVVDSFGTRWFTGWLPAGWTTRWYGTTWREFDLGGVLVVTLEVALAVVVVSLFIGVPAAYALARRTFPGKRVLMVAFLLPILIPPITYGVPLATVLYKFHLAGKLSGVILANLVPAVPFVILVMTPFIEQIDPKIEAAARMCGARTRVIFTRILGPLLLPGMLAAAILILVRTVGMFELTFLTAGPDSQTLVVALYYSVSSAGIRAQQEIDAMAVIYTMSMLVLLVVALRFVNPTQLVTQIKERD